MAKVSFDQAKQELSLLEESIKLFKEAGAPVLKMVQDRYDYLMKIISGNASAQVADLFNESIASVINATGNEALLADITKAVGTKVKLTVQIEDGKVKFEAGGTSGGGASTGATGITRAASEFNHWTVTRKPVQIKDKEGNVTADLEGKSEDFDSASKAVKFILNEGVNPMNLPANFGAGNSMVRVLNTYLPKYEDFGKTFSVEGKNVEKAKPAKEEPATETAPEATETAPEATETAE